MHNNALSHKVIGLAMRVHTKLGPGLLESIYEKCLSHELVRTQIPLKRQVPLAVEYNGETLECGYIADIIVDDHILLELKSIEHVLPVHEAQLLTYLKLTPCRIGLLINFNTTRLAEGITRRVL